MKTLKELWSLYVSDIKEDGLAPMDAVKYGLPLTLALVAACVLAEWLNTL